MLFKAEKQDINYLLYDYFEHHKSYRVVKRKKFNIGTCDLWGLIADIKKELLNQDLDKLNVGNFQFIKSRWDDS